jgi:hypothetical protein
LANVEYFDKAQKNYLLFLYILPGSEMIINLKSVCLAKNMPFSEPIKANNFLPTTLPIPSIN